MKRSTGIATVACKQDIGTTRFCEVSLKTSDRTTRQFSFTLLLQIAAITLKYDLTI
ncbi:hypothetical protein [Nostoc sp.]|uniref:hypothetical protein n=1 Tax=Nostoc sp. TaxID=1180 RepID=UPI002FF692CB